MSSPHIISQAAKRPGSVQHVASTRAEDLSLSPLQTTWTGRGTGAAGPRAPSPADTGTRREPGHVVTPARPPSRGRVTCPSAQVKTDGGQLLSERTSPCVHRAFISPKVLKTPSGRQRLKSVCWQEQTSSTPPSSLVLVSSWLTRPPGVCRSLNKIPIDVKSLEIPFVSVQMTA